MNQTAESAFRAWIALEHERTNYYRPTPQVAFEGGWRSALKEVKTALIAYAADPMCAQKVFALVEGMMEEKEE